MRMKNDFHIKGWRLSFPRKKLEFKSSEMAKNVSIIHKVERSFIYLCTTVCENHTVIDLARSQNLIVLLLLWKVQIVWLKKIYIWISLLLASITS